MGSSILRERLGKTAGHVEQGPTTVEAYQLDTDRLAITVWTYGASLVEVWVPDRSYDNGERPEIAARGTNRLAELSSIRGARVESVRDSDEARELLQAFAQFCDESRGFWQH